MKPEPTEPPQIGDELVRLSDGKRLELTADGWVTWGFQFCDEGGTPLPVTVSVTPTDSAVDERKLN